MCTTVLSMQKRTMKTKTTIIVSRQYKLMIWLHQCWSQILVVCQLISLIRFFSHLGHLITNKFSDLSDILERRCDLIGHVNNVLCYFCNLTPCVKNGLFQPFCTSLYGCELWLLTTNEIEDSCLSWRKGVRRVWDLSYTFHPYLLHMLSQCISLLGKICQRSINFIRSCVSHDSFLVSRIAL